MKGMKATLVSVVTNHVVQVMLKETFFHKQNTASSVCGSKKASLRRTFCNAMASSNEVRNAIHWHLIFYQRKPYIQIHTKNERGVLIRLEGRRMVGRSNGGKKLKNNKWGDY